MIEKRREGSIMTNEEKSRRRMIEATKSEPGVSNWRTNVSSTKLI